MKRTRHLPRSLRGVVRRARKRAEYTGLRMLSHVTTNTGPLRGYYPNAKLAVAECGGSYTLLDRECSIDYTPLPSSRTALPSLAKVGSPETFVAVIPNGHVLYDYGVIVSPNRRLIGEVSGILGDGPPNEHVVMFEASSPIVRHIAGAVAVLSSSAHQRYFHWMFDVLPRYDLLTRSGLPVDFYVANRGTEFQRETLTHLGIPETKVFDPQLNSHIVADQLIVPSLPGRIGFMTQRSCRYLRNAFLSAPRTRCGRRIYLTRLDAATRRVANEHELTTCLATLGFEFVELTGMSVLDQADLFSSAEVIVGPHGAGLTNIVFCSPGTLIVELMSPTYQNYCFQRLASLQSLRIVSVTGLSAESGGVAQAAEPTHDFRVDTETVAALVGV
jgi:hypothetical protein